MVYPDLSGEENLAFFAGLHGVESSALARSSERFELGAFMKRPVRTYSRGQLQRLSLARALLHAPRLLLLDEPSTGLDARGVVGLCEAIAAERARGAIVVLVTHDGSFAATVADQRVQLERGQIASAAA
jgi:ABC-type multidrug transport system ATPase subunit